MKEHQSSSSNRLSPSPLKEQLRLQALKEHKLLDSPRDSYYEGLTRLASKFTNAPICLISLVDQHRQFFKSSIGLPEELSTLRETPLTHSFCQHVVRDEKTMIVNDSLKDDRVKDNAAIKDLGVASYLGAPIIDSNGNALGAFCAIDNVPREWTEENVQTMEDLARLIVTELDRVIATDQAAASAEHLKLQNLHMKDCFTILVHDLKNPLSGIALTSAMMREHLPADSPELTAMLDNISNSSEKMSGHINSLLERGSAGLSCMTYHPKLVDLTWIVNGCISNQASQLNEKSITVTVSGAEENYFVMVDPLALDQILENLLSNSIKFSPEKSEIFIELSPTGFTITDQGPGFTAEDEKKLFQRFSSLSAEATNDTNSTGLGLYICKQLAEAMSGTIEYLGTPETSATFRLDFPVSEIPK